MAELDAGRMDLQLSATAGDQTPTGPVGFRMEGPFSFTGGGPLPVLDLRYTRLLGGERGVVRVVSTGQELFVVDGGEVRQVPEDAAARLRLGDRGGGFADLGVAGWVREPRVEEGAGGGRVVRGTVDVGDLLSDLARLAGQVGGVDSEPLDDEAAQRLDRLARASEATVELGDDDLPRSVRAVVDFGGTVPDDLRRALGQYAAARLELTVALERLEGPLTVAKPTG